LGDIWEYDALKNTWAQKGDFDSTSRYGAVSFSINNKGYIGTGSRGSYNFPKDFWEFDPYSNTWTQKADFAGATRFSATGFSIGNKGYVGLGRDYGVIFKDFWEYDPDLNAWIKKADFKGNARSEAVGFSIGNKGYIGTGDIGDLPTQDFWEYDPAANAWTLKAKFPGVGRTGAVGFSIGNKGYVGLGRDKFNNYPKDFWEYSPALNAWTKKADFIADTGRCAAISFEISGKGYLGTGYLGQVSGELYYFKDFWEYDTLNNTWTQKQNFRGGARSWAIGLSIGEKGYIGAGINSEHSIMRDWWEYTPGDCTKPINLFVSKTKDTCSIFSWNTPDSSVEHIKISYRKLGDSVWIEDRKKSLENSKVICGLIPNTTYEWKVRNICADDKTGWIHGPNFTTTSSVAFSSTTNDNKIAGRSIQIMPNPNNGNFTIQMHLSNKAASTKLSIYNSFGVKIWQEDAGKLSGSVSKKIALENKLSGGVYILIIEYGDTRLIQKVVVFGK
jgi:hypothetical protein